MPVFYPGPKKVNEESQNEKEYVLKDIVTRPCVVNGRAKLDDLCIQYSYIGVNKPGFVKVQAENGYTYDRQRGRRVTQVFADNEILKELDFSALALLNKQQVGRKSMKRPCV